MKADIYGHKIYGLRRVNFNHLGEGSHGKPPQLKQCTHMLSNVVYAVQCSEPMCRSVDWGNKTTTS